MEAIVICGMPAAGKTTLARILGARLGLPMLGGNDILEEMAIERGYKSGGDDWWDTEEGLRFLAERAANPDFDKETDRRMRERIAKGDVVATSYTAPWIIKEGFKVWLSATPETRARRMAARDGRDARDTLKVILERDEENRKLYKNLYGIDFGNDLAPFDAVVLTDDKDSGQVADIVIEKFNVKQE
jgi:cytidylate kinase